MEKKVTNLLYGKKLKSDREDKIVKSLLDNSSDPATQPTPSRIKQPTPSRIKNAESYIILPGRSHGSYSYPDLLVPTQRTHLGETWKQVSQSVPAEGGLMLTIRQYVDFLSHLKSGDKVYDARGILVDKLRINSLLDDILSLRDPFRAEWLDAKFKKTGIFCRTRNIQYHKIESDGSLKKVTEQLDDCLMGDRRIDLDYWLSNATPQGLPPKNTPSGNLNYWRPRGGNATWFRADYDRVDLFCDWYPQGSDAGLGVRVAKIKR